MTAIGTRVQYPPSNKATRFMDVPRHAETLSAPPWDMQSEEQVHCLQRRVRSGLAAVGMAPAMPGAQCDARTHAGSAFVPVELHSRDEDDTRKILAAGRYSRRGRAITPVNQSDI